MKDILTKILIVGLVASAVKVFIFDGMWPSLAAKKTIVEEFVNKS